MYFYPRKKRFLQDFHLTDIKVPILFFCLVMCNIKMCNINLRYFKDSLVLLVLKWFSVIFGRIYWVMNPMTERFCFQSCSTKIFLIFFGILLFLRKYVSGFLRTTRRKAFLSPTTFGLYISCRQFSVRTTQFFFVLRRNACRYSNEYATVESLVFRPYTRYKSRLRKLLFNRSCNLM